LGCCFDEGIVLGFVIAGGKCQPWTFCCRPFVWVVVLIKGLC
jgi:hypothetical protein